MKKITALALVLCLGLGLAGCTAAPNGDEGPEMYMEAAQLTEEEENLAELLGLNTKHRIFDFVVDDTVQSVQINTYELVDGQWDRRSGGGGQALTAGEGRIALDFDRIPEGLRVAVQSESGTTATAHGTQGDPELEGMGYATSVLGDRTEIVYDQEIPLAIQIITAQNEVTSYVVEYFHTPEEYEKHGYEHVYAITVRFSQKSVSELSTLG